MSLMTMRLNERKKNAFLSDCFNFTWLGKYRVYIQVFKNRYSVFIKNFTFCFDDDHLPFVVSALGQISCKNFFNAKDAVVYYNLKLPVVNQSSYS